MSLSEKEAIEMFVNIVESGDYFDNSLEVKHIYRGYSIDQISPDKFRISIERHPHLFDRPSFGRASSAFATIKKTYELNTETQKVNFVDEEVVDIEIDYYALAEEDFSEVTDWFLNEEERNKLVSLKTRDDVLDFAEELVEKNEIDKPSDELYITSYELPTDFSENLAPVLKRVFVDKIIEKWEWSK